MGNPVVPDVYWIITGSEGSGSSRSPVNDDADAISSAHSSKRMISRSSGHSGCTSWTIDSIGLPRNSVAVMTPAERDWFSTYCTSWARKPGFTVTMISPAIALANSSTTHSG